MSCQRSVQCVSATEKRGFSVNEKSGFIFIHFFILFCAFLEATWCPDGKSRTAKEKKKRRRSEQFAHDNMCDYLHHNGSHRCSKVSLVSSSHVSEQLMCGTRCNRSSCPGRTGAWPPGSSFAWHGDFLFSPAKKMEKPHRSCRKLFLGAGGDLLTSLSLKVVYIKLYIKKMIL